MLSVEEVVSEVRGQLIQHVDEAYREGCRNFFKEPVDPWGVRSKDLRLVEVRLYKLLKAVPKVDRYAVFEELWRSGKLEEGAMVCHVGRRFRREFDRTDFQRFERWIDTHVQNWSHADGVASWLLAGCLENDPSLRDRVLRWTKSKNRWKRRSAAVAFLQEAKSGRSIDYICDVSQRLKDDSDVMVQKGVGWLLKETYPKRPEETVEFLRLTQFPRLVVRYAAEKMSSADRREFGLS